MQTDGQHVMADIWLVEFEMTATDLRERVLKALDESGMTVLNFSEHDFGGGAYTGIWLLAESHFSVHTFPERNFISVDCYTCGDNGKPLACVSSFVERLSVDRLNITSLRRGQR